MNWIRRVLIRFTSSQANRVGALMAGLVYIRIEKPEIDYSEYLGPDWKKTYKGESTILINHSSWIVLLSS